VSDKVPFEAARPLSETSDLTDADPGLLEPQPPQADYSKAMALADQRANIF
jgi:hypothetical protein